MPAITTQGHTYVIEFGWCGVGRDQELGGMRLGLIRVARLRGRISQRLACYRDMLRLALVAIPANDATRACIASFLDVEAPRAPGGHA